MGGRCGSLENEGKIYGAFIIEDSVKWGKKAICRLFKAEPLLPVLVSLDCNPLPSSF
jgi:hypothetical protein